MEACDQAVVVYLVATEIGTFMTDGTVSRPSVPSSPAEDSMSANDGRRRQKYRHRPSSTVTGRHRAVTINTYTLTLERAVQDIIDLSIFLDSQSVVRIQVRIEQMLIATLALHIAVFPTGWLAFSVGPAGPHSRKL